MTPEDLVAIRKGVKFSQQEFSNRLGVGIRTYQKWELGESPIRPMVAQSVKNVEELVRIENKARQAKSVSEKADALRESLGVAIRGLKDIGAHSRSSDRMLELLAENKVPSKDEVASLFRTLESPARLSQNTNALMRLLVQKVRALSDGDEVAIEAFRAMVESLPAEDYESLIEWAESKYLMTSTDVVKSAYKAIIKQLDALA